VNKDRYTQQRVIDAIQAAKGIKATAAQSLGCSRQTVTNYIDRYPAVKAAYQEAKDTTLDLAESKLIALVEREEWPAIRFMLVTLGKSRGYVERQEISQVGGDYDAIRQQLQDDYAKVYGDEDE
jgi:hypothetical protein